MVTYVATVPRANAAKYGNLSRWRGRGAMRNLRKFNLPSVMGGYRPLWEKGDKRVEG